MKTAVAAEFSGAANSSCFEALPSVGSHRFLSADLADLRLRVLPASSTLE